MDLLSEGERLVGRSFFAVRLEPKTSCRATELSLIRLDPARPRQASGQDQRLTKSHSDKGAAIIPIDAQLLGTSGFGRAAEAGRM